jgi:uncharacterized membrane protein YbhN (UPF0104 family)
LNGEPGGKEATRGASIWRVARPLLLLAVAFLAARIIIGIVGKIDWSAVRASVGLLTLPAVILLLLVLGCRQAFNAVPLTRFVPGLSLPRSVQNDVTAFLIGTVAPPPSDVVLRVSMFRSWGIDPVEGMAGVTLNMMVFYVVRFAAPAVGLLFLVFEEIEAGQVWLAIASGVVAVAILVALISISRGDRLATLIGYSAGRVAARFRSDVEPELWAAAVVDFRARVGDRVKTGVAPSLLALLAMVLSDSVILLLALRTVGVQAQALPVTLVIGAFLLAYPLTLFPLAGLGILDAVLVAAWTQAAGIEFEAQIVAALIIWRVVSLLVPIAMGAVALLAWRRGRPAVSPA